MDTLRLFLATVAAEDLECSQFDIKNAFTESHLKETIYREPPNGLDVKRVYVDDIAALANNQGEIDWFSRLLQERFKTKPLGEIKKILGARMTRDRPNRTLYIDQEEYITSVLDKFGITHSKRRAKTVPAADYENFRPVTLEDTQINVTEYQQAIGSITYAIILTRPDIAFVLGKLSQSMSDPAKHHGQALKYLLRYLKSTVKQKIHYGPDGAYKHFFIYSDADWAGDTSDRKSVSRSVAMFYGGLISWSSKKQRCVATSSCESESSCHLAPSRFN
ncbi:hypothetical protein K3495_g1100 [Podosphaera aphanis]|nr:hypothetical protein K3495_g1100 [Podosphaera aphanis]